MKNEHQKVTIKELRAKWGGMTQVQLGKAIGIPQTTISKWEKNIRTISPDNLEKLCHYFGVTATDILGF